MENIVKAVQLINPNAEFSISGGVVTFINLKGDSEPSDSAIDAKLTELTTAYNNKKYQRDRVAAYPSLTDQLDMQYWDKKNGTTTWVDAVAKVKSDNPKP